MTKALSPATIAIFCGYVLLLAAWLGLSGAISELCLALCLALVLATSRDHLTGALGAGYLLVLIAHTPLTIYTLRASIGDGEPAAIAAVLLTHGCLVFIAMHLLFPRQPNPAEES